MAYPKRSLRLLFVIFSGVLFAHAAMQPLHQDVLREYCAKGTPFDFYLVDLRGKGEIIEMIGNKNCRPYNLEWPDEFKLEILRVPRDAAVIVYCASGGRATGAANWLTENGYTKVFNAGGMSTWQGPIIPLSAARSSELLPEFSMKASPNIR